MKDRITRAVQRVSGDVGKRVGETPGWRISFTARELASQLVGFFPLEKPWATGVWLFESPSVDIDPVTHRLLVDFDASWGRGERWRLGARVSVSGSFRYDPTQATLFLQHLRLEELRWHGTRMVPLRRLLQAAQLPLGLTQFEIPLLQLDGKGFGSRLARMVLQGVDVQDGKLWFTLGLPGFSVISSASD